VPSEFDSADAAWGDGQMLQCNECEHFTRGEGGQVGFRCDPFSTVKEPECLVKWQLIKSSETARLMDRMARAYEATIQMYEKLAPLQEKMFRHMEREIDDYDETESWKDSKGEDEDGDGDGDGDEGEDQGENDLYR
jgi:hypothetical protein